MTPDTRNRSVPRFRGRAAGTRSQHLAAAMVALPIAAAGTAGIVGGVTFLAFFAVGAGAGYSLSGSV